MEIQTYTDSVEVKMEINLLHVEINADLVAYKLSRGPLPEQKLLAQLGDKLEVSVEEGFTTKGDLERFIAGKSKAIKKVALNVVHPEVLAAVRTKGFSDGLDFNGAHPFGNGTPFTDLTERGADLSNIVRIDYGSHMLFDLDEEALPVAIHCDYIHAHMHNGAYDLDKAEMILKRDPRVRFIEAKQGYYARSRVDNDSFSQDIPSFNASNTRSRHLQFWFMPTAEDAKRLWTQQKSYGTACPSLGKYRAMFDLDILGLRAGGAAKYGDFHQWDEDNDD